MSDIIQGTIVSFDKETKYRKADNKPFTIVWMKLDNGEAVNCGFKAPPNVEVGDDVTVEYKVAYGEKKLEKVTQGISAQAPRASAPSTSSGGSYNKGGKPFPIPPLHGDRAIVRQNSLTNAVKLVGIMGMELGYLENDDADVVVDKVLKIARRFEEYSTGDIERRMAEQGMDAETAMKSLLEGGSE